MIRFAKKVSAFNWKYGLGEVVLIFIGITLAIWFDSWNQHRVDRGKERLYLDELKRDLESDKSELNFLIAENQLRMSGINRMNEVLSDSDINILCDSIQHYVSISSFISVFSGSSTVFQDLQSTGNLLLIEDSDFKRRMMTYYSKIDTQKKYEDLNSRFHINTQGVFIKNEWNTGGLFRLGRGEKNLQMPTGMDDCKETYAKVDEFRNNLDLYTAFTNHLNFSYFIASINTKEYQKLLVEATNLIDLIDHYYNK